MRACAAAEVEERAGPGAEQAKRRGAPVIVQLAEELGVVPVGNAVVPRHRSMLAPCLEPPERGRCRGSNMWIRAGVILVALAVAAGGLRVRYGES